MIHKYDQLNLMLRLINVEFASSINHNFSIDSNNAFQNFMYKNQNFKVEFHECSMITEM